MTLQGLDGFHLALAGLLACNAIVLAVAITSLVRLHRDFWVEVDARSRRIFLGAERVGPTPGKHWDEYPRARWRGNTPVHEGEIAIFIDVEAQSIPLRLRLPVWSAQMLAKSILEQVEPENPSFQSRERLHDL